VIGSREFHDVLFGLRDVGAEVVECVLGVLRRAGKRREHRQPAAQCGHRGVHVVGCLDERTAEREGLAEGPEGFVVDVLGVPRGELGAQSRRDADAVELPSSLDLEP
jgi:hypothetical protein